MIVKVQSHYLHLVKLTNFLRHLLSFQAKLLVTTGGTEGLNGRFTEVLDLFDKENVCKIGLIGNN